METNYRDPGAEENVATCENIPGTKSKDGAGSGRWIKIALVVTGCLLVTSLAANVIMLIFFLRPGGSCSCEASLPRDSETSLEATTTAISTESPKPHMPCYLPNPSTIVNYTLPFEAEGFADTSQGDLVIVGNEGSAAIFNKRGDIKRNLLIPGAKYFRGVARQDDILFIAEFSTKIHVIHEQGTYIKLITTQIRYIRNMAISKNTIWLSTHNYGVYTLTFDNDYNIIKSELFAASNNSFFNLPNGIVVDQAHVIVVGTFSDNLHIFDLAGNRIVATGNSEGSADDQLNAPRGVTTDIYGRIYIADSYNNRIVLYSSSGQFIQKIVTKDDGIVGWPTRLLLQNNYLFFTTYTYPNKLLYVVELI